MVGAGISGALVADALADAGREVLVVDRRPPCAGSTAASTALLLYEIDEPVSRLANRFGRATAVAAWRRSKLALDALAERSEALAIDADLERRDSLYLQGERLAAAALHREFEERRRAGFEVAFLEAPEVRRRFGISGRSAILSFGCMTADPRRLAAGFLRNACSLGARFASPIVVERVEHARGRIRVAIDGGRFIHARSLVFATGYELAHGVPRRGHEIVSTWAMATRPQPAKLWPSRALIWEASDPYLYVRATPEGAVICGGEDEPFADDETRDALIPAKIAAIRRKLARLLPGIDTTPEYVWAGAFGASRDGLPSIGPVPRMPGCYAVLGYGGNGITYSMLAAQILRSAILGARDPDAALFGFGRGRR